MANFHTHLTYAAAGSGLMSVLVLQVGLVEPRDALSLALVGTIGGILPDIDLQHAYPSRIMFSMLGILSAFMMIFSLENDMSIVELWLIGMTTFAVIRWPMWQLFHQYTTHRGSTHSLLAAIFAMFATAALSFHLMEKEPLTAWITGLFIFIGYLIHLLLDELYSVDFMNRRLKRSFGTALKIVDVRNRTNTILLFGATLFIWFLTPDATQFFDTLKSAQTYNIIGHRLLP